MYLSFYQKENKIPRNKKKVYVILELWVKIPGNFKKDVNAIFMFINEIINNGICSPIMILRIVLWYINLFFNL